MDYQIKLFSEINKELKEYWLKIEENSQSTCFNSIAWIENYILSYKEDMINSKLRIFVIFYENEPVCIFPFEIVKKYKVNVLQWICDLKTDFNAPPQKKNFSFEKDSFNQIWNKLIKMIPEVDVIFLKKQVNFSDTKKNPFISFLKNKKEGYIYKICLPQRWDDYTKKILKKKFYFDLVRTKKLIKKEGKVEFITAKNSEQKKIFLEELVKQKKHKLSKNNINLFNEKDLNFYKNFENYKNKKYTTHVTAIKLNGEFIAMHWGIFAKNYYYYLLPSMKEGRFKRFSPGKLLLSILVRWAISKKIDFFDFGLGEESYKKKWSNKKENIYSYIRLNKLKGIFYYITIKIVKTIILFKKNINR